MNEWLDELDRRGTDMWKVALKKRMGGWTCSAVRAPRWFASLDVERIIDSD